MSNQPPPPAPSPAYAAERVRALAEREREGHFWFAPRRRRLLDLLAKRLPPGAAFLDVGCGTGGLVNALRARGVNAQGVDPHAVATGLDPAAFSSGRADALPWPDATFDALGAFDVIEHVDDEAALREFRRVLRPGGLLFVSVPAYPSLWGERDVEAGHLRRYTRRSLRARLAASGFVLKHVSGYQFFLLPLVWWNRRARGSTRREDEVARPLNRLLRAVNSAEVALSRLAPPPVGSSLIAAARAPL